MAKKTTDALSGPRRRATGTAGRTPASAKPRKKPAVVPGPTFEQIAEAAYHRYLKRGGGSGTDFGDWLEAERDLRARTKNSR